MFKKGHKLLGGEFKKGEISYPKRSMPKDKKHHWWKGGRRKHGQYVGIYCPTHPFVTKAGYVFEHRLVMEGVLKRYLNPAEKVHHKNGIKNDNRPGNLMLYVENKNWHPCLCPKCGFEFLIK